jgi:hypothetical protein
VDVIAGLDGADYALKSLGAASQHRDRDQQGQEEYGKNPETFHALPPYEQTG